MSITGLMGKRELIALLNLSSWCLVMVERLFLAVPRGCLQFVIVVFPDHTHLLFLMRRLSLIGIDAIWQLSLGDALAVCWAHWGLPVGFLLLRYSVLFTVES